MPQYSEHGDCLSLYFKDEDSYGERVDNILTVFRSMADDELIGFEIKGVRKILRKLGQLGVSFQDGSTEIGMIVAGYALSQRDPAPPETLQHIGRAVLGRRASIPAERELVDV